MTMNKNELTYRAFGVDMEKKEWIEMGNVETSISLNLNEIRFKDIVAVLDEGINDSGVKWQTMRYDNVSRFRNHSHPLLTAYGDLGFMIFGGFDDEKKFIAVLPSSDKFKKGDIWNFRIESFIEWDSETEEGDYFAKSQTDILIKSIITIAQISEVQKYSDYERGSGAREYVSYPKEIIETLLGHDIEHGNYPEIYFESQGNLIEEYVKTGELENPLSKNFIKYYL